MAEYGYVEMPDAVPANSRKVSIVGIGESDYHDDYRAERAKAKGYQSPTYEELGQRALERALADAGMRPDAVDGLALSFTFGGPDPDILLPKTGLTPHDVWQNGHIMAGPLPAACGRIMRGEFDTIAMLFTVANRSSGRVFGGMTFASGMGGPSSYYYYHPWGWSSQAAHWAMMASRYLAKYGYSEEDLGTVPQQVRAHAAATPQAVMQKRFSIEDYMASPYIVNPLHLFDLCLRNDGAVCLILTGSDRARDCARPAIEVAGWGESYVKADKLRTMVEDRLAPQMRDAGKQALGMAGLSLDDVGHLEGYDASSMHLVNHVEGLGFCAPGEGIALCKDGGLTQGGRIPTNTAGGNMSGSYMQGWSQIVEAVRQLRGEAGERQIAGLNASLTCLAQTDAAHPLILTRGN